MNAEYLAKKEILDECLASVISSNIQADNPLYSAMEYGVSTPGKRIRGVLTLAFCERLGVPQEQALPFAVALEMIHAYSLVHDDMPEMDNDDFRRGQPTCHKKYGADMALLAGDGILNFALEYLLLNKKLYQPARFLEAVEILFCAAGANGMLCGQAMDKIGESRMLSIDELLLLHRKKTGALLLAPVQIAEALSASKSDNYVNYSKNIGLAFQIKDDLLDVEGSSAVLGKEVGKDLAEHKSTFVSVLGVNAAKDYLQQELLAAIGHAGTDEFLLWLADYIGNREK